MSRRRTVSPGIDDILRPMAEEWGIDWGQVCHRSDLIVQRHMRKRAKRKQMRSEYGRRRR